MSQFEFFAKNVISGMEISELKELGKLVKETISRKKDEKLKTLSIDAMKNDDIFIKLVGEAALSLFPGAHRKRRDIAYDLAKALGLKTIQHIAYFNNLIMLIMFSLILIMMNVIMITFLGEVKWNF